MTQDIKISLSAKSLIKLISALKEANCAEFKYNNLSINFNHKQIEIEPASTASIEFKADKNQEPTLEEMMISDPVGYEEALNAKLEREL